MCLSQPRILPTLLQEISLRCTTQRNSPFHQIILLPILSQPPLPNDEDETGTPKRASQPTTGWSLISTSKLEESLMRSTPMGIATTPLFFLPPTMDSRSEATANMAKQTVMNTVQGLSCPFLDQESLKGKGHRPSPICLISTQRSVNSLIFLFPRIQRE